MTKTKTTNTKASINVPVVVHSLRFRTFGNAYPRAVTLAYGGDLYRAMRSTDKQVARMVLKWLKREGRPMRGWGVARRAAEGRGK